MVVSFNYNGDEITMTRKTKYYGSGISFNIRELRKRDIIKLLFRRVLNAFQSNK